MSKFNIGDLIKDMPEKPGTWEIIDVLGLGVLAVQGESGQTSYFRKGSLELAKTESPDVPRIEKQKAGRGFGWAKRFLSRVKAWAGFLRLKRWFCRNNPPRVDFVQVNPENQPIDGNGNRVDRWESQI